MIKQFTVRAYGNAGRNQVESAVKATLLALGIIDPRVLVTQTHATEFDVVMATDEAIDVE